MKINWEITLTAGKLYAVLILALGFVAIFQGYDGVAYISVLAGAGLYGWRKRETRKMMEKKDETIN